MTIRYWKLSEDERRKIITELKNRGRQTLHLARKRVLEDTIVDPTARKTLRKCVSSWNKLAQPWLLSLACESVGGETSIANRLSTGLILLGGGLDLHDDIIDKTLNKHGTRTCFGMYGPDRTMLAGDYLIVKGLTTFSRVALASLPKRLAIKVIGILERAMIEMMDAESIELGFRKNLEIIPGEYLEMVVKKSADFEAYFRIGAVLSDADLKTERSLSRFGRTLGVLVILRDDISDVIDPKLANNRLNNESYPLPILLALQDAAVKSEMVRILRRQSYSKQDCRLLFDLVYKGNGLKKMEETMLGFMTYAAKQLEEIQRKEPLETILKAVFPPFHVLTD